MSKIDVLLHNPENYKTICNVTERCPLTCEGCIVRGLCGMHSKTPIIPYRREIEQTIGLLSHE